MTPSLTTSLLPVEHAWTPTPNHQLQMQWSTSGPESQTACQNKYQTECQEECQIERQNICQIECPKKKFRQNVLNRCQIECLNRYQIECLKLCQQVCQNICIYTYIYICAIFAFRWYVRTYVRILGVRVGITRSKVFLLVLSSRLSRIWPCFATKQIHVSNMFRTSSVHFRGVGPDF